MADSTIANAYASRTQAADLNGPVSNNPPASYVDDNSIDSQGRPARGYRRASPSYEPHQGKNGGGRRVTPERALEVGSANRENGYARPPQYQNQNQSQSQSGSGYRGYRGQGGAGGGGADYFAECVSHPLTRKPDRL